MLRATFLGWQSWLLESEAARILIDPLLLEEAGRGLQGMRQSFPIWPPRIWSWDEFPPIDCVVITHEHEDHFDVRSLARIDRDVAVHVSSRSSMATHTILGEMGFRVQPLVPGGAFLVGDLEVCPMSPIHDPARSCDEWDTLAYLVRHQSGDGNFFSNVDVGISREMERAVQRAELAPGGGAVTTLCHDQMCLCVWPPPGVDDERNEHCSHKPAAGFLPVAEEALAALLRGERLRPIPGQSVACQGGRLVACAETARFLRTPPMAEWGSQEAFRASFDDDLMPRCGVEDLPASAVPELEEGLRRFAEFLYGSRTFMQLYSLDERTLEGRAPTFVLLLLVDRDMSAVCYEYRARECGFTRVTPPDDLAGAYVGYVICWATDLLALMRGDFEPRTMMRSMRETWSIPGIDFAALAMWPYFHPLRHPASCLRQHRAQLEAERGAPIQVRARPPA